MRNKSPREQLKLSADEMREIQADADFRRPVAALEQAIEQDRAAGMRTYCTAGTASTTKLLGKTVMRLCTNNPRTTASDLRQTVQIMGRLAADLESRLGSAPKGDSRPA
jgi:antitoxin component HigA of HigAB toxin-antitoxin module